MSEIRDVKVEPIKEIGIPPVKSIFTGLPVKVPQSPPVTVTIGSPIVDMPGCVEYNPNGPGLVKDDPNGTYTLCDGNIPSFNPIEYEPDGMIMTGPPEPVPKLDETAPEVPDTSVVQQVPQIPASTVVPEPKNEVVEVQEEPTFVEKYLPTAEEVTTTVTIATAAAAAAVFGKPLAELILKLIKPAVKKVVQKVKNKLGKEGPILSVTERRQLQRRMRE